MKKLIAVSGTSAVFIVFLSLVAWLTGSPFIFPSLGPTAYILAFDSKQSHSADTVIGGHICGVIGGLAGYYIFASPYDFTMIAEPLSTPGFYLTLGAVFSILVTSFLMLLLDVSHPPACATTLIISLGILSDWGDGVIIILAVTLLYLIYRSTQKLVAAFDSSPYDTSKGL